MRSAPVLALVLCAVFGCARVWADCSTALANSWWIWDGAEGDGLWDSVANWNGPNGNDADTPQNVVGAAACIPDAAAITLPTGIDLSNVEIRFMGAATLGQSTAKTSIRVKAIALEAAQAVVINAYSVSGSSEALVVANINFLVASGSLTVTAYGGTTVTGTVFLGSSCSATFNGWDTDPATGGVDGNLRIGGADMLSGSALYVYQGGTNGQPIALGEANGVVCQQSSTVTVVSDSGADVDFGAFTFAAGSSTVSISSYDSSPAIHGAVSASGSGTTALWQWVASHPTSAPAFTSISATGGATISFANNDALVTFSSTVTTLTLTGSELNGVVNSYTNNWAVTNCVMSGAAKFKGLNTITIGTLTTTGATAATLVQGTEGLHITGSSSWAPAIGTLTATAGNVQIDSAVTLGNAAGAGVVISASGLVNLNLISGQSGSPATVSVTFDADSVMTALSNIATFTVTAVTPGRQLTASADMAVASAVVDTATLRVAALTATTGVTLQNGAALALTGTNPNSLGVITAGSADTHAITCTQNPTLQFGSVSGLSTLGSLSISCPTSVLTIGSISSAAGNSGGAVSITGGSGSLGGGAVLTASNVDVTLNGAFTLAYASAISCNRLTLTTAAVSTDVTVTVTTALALVSAMLTGQSGVTVSGTVTLTKPGSTVPQLRCLTGTVNVNAVTASSDAVIRGDRIGMGGTASVSGTNSVLTLRSDNTGAAATLSAATFVWASGSVGARFALNFAFPVDATGIAFTTTGATDPALQITGAVVSGLPALSALAVVLNSGGGVDFGSAGAFSPASCAFNSGTGRIIGTNTGAVCNALTVAAGAALSVEITAAGGLTVNGAVSLASGSTITAPGTVANTALTFGSSAVLTLAGTFSSLATNVFAVDFGTATVTGAAALTLTGPSGAGALELRRSGGMQLLANGGAATVNGRVQFSAAFTGGTGAQVTLSAAANLDVSVSGTADFSTIAFNGPSSGSAAVNKRSGGTLNLAAANAVSGGTLQLLATDGAAQFGLSAVSVAATATLSLGDGVTAQVTQTTPGLSAATGAVSCAAGSCAFTIASSALGLNIDSAFAALGSAQFTVTAGRTSNLNGAFSTGSSATLTVLGGGSGAEQVTTSASTTFVAAGNIKIGTRVTLTQAQASGAGALWLTGCTVQSGNTFGATTLRGPEAGVTTTFASAGSLGKTLASIAGTVVVSGTSFAATSLQFVGGATLSAGPLSGGLASPMTFAGGNTLSVTSTTVSGAITLADLLTVQLSDGSAVVSSSIAAGSNAATLLATAASGSTWTSVITASAAFQFRQSVVTATAWAGTIATGTNAVTLSAEAASVVIGGTVTSACTTGPAVTISGAAAGAGSNAALNLKAAPAGTFTLALTGGTATFSGVLNVGASAVTLNGVSGTTWAGDVYHGAAATTPGPATYTFADHPFYPTQTVAGGVWSSEAVWSSNAPSATAHATVNSGHVMTTPASTATVAELVLLGTCTVAFTNGELTVTSLLNVNGAGTKTITGAVWSTGSFTVSGATVALSAGAELRIDGGAGTVSGVLSGADATSVYRVMLSSINLQQITSFTGAKFLFATGAGSTTDHAVFLAEGITALPVVQVDSQNKVTFQTAANNDASGVTIALYSAASDSEVASLIDLSFAAGAAHAFAGKITAFLSSVTVTLAGTAAANGVSITLQNSFLRIAGGFQFAGANVIQPAMSANGVIAPASGSVTAMVNSGATVTLNEGITSQATQKWAGAGTVVLEGAVLNVAAPDTFDALLHGSSSAITTGTIAITGSVTATKAVTAKAGGRLLVSAAATTSELIVAAALTVETGATLASDNPRITANAGGAALSGTVEVVAGAGAATIAIGGSGNAWAGTAGAFVSSTNTAGVSFSCACDVGAGVAVAVTPSAALTLGGAWTVAGSLALTGAPTVTFTGSIANTGSGVLLPGNRQLRFGGRSLGAVRAVSGLILDTQNTASSSIGALTFNAAAAATVTVQGGNTLTVASIDLSSRDDHSLVLSSTSVTATAGSKLIGYVTASAGAATTFTVAGAGNQISGYFTYSNEDAATANVALTIDSFAAGTYLTMVGGAVSLSGTFTGAAAGQDFSFGSSVTSSLVFTSCSAALLTSGGALNPPSANALNVRLRVPPAAATMTIAVPASTTVAVPYAEVGANSFLSVTGPSNAALSIAAVEVPATATAQTAGPALTLTGNVGGAVRATTSATVSGTFAITSATAEITAAGTNTLTLLSATVTAAATFAVNIKALGAGTVIVNGCTLSSAAATGDIHLGGASNAVQFSGATTNVNGVVQLDGATVAGSVTVGGSGVLRVASATAVAASGTFTVLPAASGAAFDLRQAFTVTDGATLTLGAGASAILSLTRTAPGVLTAGGAGSVLNLQSVNAADAALGTMAFTPSGSNTISLTAARAYTVGAGTGTTVFTGAQAVTVTNAAAQPAAFTTQSNAALTIAGAFSQDGTVTVSSGSLTVNTGATVTDVALSGSALTVAGGTAAGNIVLSAESTITVSSGVFTAAVNAGAFKVTLVPSVAIAGSVSSTVSGADAVLVNGAGTVNTAITLTAAANVHVSAGTYAGTVRANGGFTVTFVVDGPGIVLNAVVKTTPTGDVQPPSAGAITYTISRPVAARASTAWDLASTWDINAVPTSQAEVLIDGYNVLAPAANAVASSVELKNGGSLTTGAFSVTAGALRVTAGTGTVTGTVIVSDAVDIVGGATLALTALTTVQTKDAAVTGSLTGASASTSVFSVTGGLVTLHAGAHNALLLMRLQGAVTLSVGAGAVTVPLLTLNTAALTVSATSGALTVGDLTATGTSSLAGTLTVSGGGGSTLTGSTFALAANAHLTVGGSTAHDWSGATLTGGTGAAYRITGNTATANLQNLVLSTGAKLELNGAAVHSGASGSVQIGSTGQVVVTSASSVASAQKLVFRASGASSSHVLLQANLQLPNAANTLQLGVDGDANALAVTVQSGSAAKFSFAAANVNAVLALTNCLITSDTASAGIAIDTATAAGLTGPGPASTSTIVFGGTPTLAFTASVTGALVLTAQSGGAGAYVATVSTTGTFSGALTVSAATGAILSAGTFSGPISVTGTGVSGNALTTNAGITISSAISFAGDASVSFTAGSTFSAAVSTGTHTVTASAGTTGGTFVQSAGGVLILTGTGAFAAAVTVNGGNTAGVSGLQFSGSLGASGGVTIAADARVTVAAGATISTGLSAGTHALTIEAAGAFDSAVTTGTSGRLTLVGAGNFGTAAAITVGAAATQPALTLNGPTVRNQITLTAAATIAWVAGSWQSSVRPGNNAVTINTAAALSDGTNNLEVRTTGSADVIFTGASAAVPVVTTATAVTRVFLSSGAYTGAVTHQSSGLLTVETAAATTWTGAVSVGDASASTFAVKLIGAATGAIGGTVTGADSPCTVANEGSFTGTVTANRALQVTSTVAFGAAITCTAPLTLGGVGTFSGAIQVDAADVLVTVQGGTTVSGTVSTPAGSTNSMVVDLDPSAHVTGTVAVNTGATLRITSSVAGAPGFSGTQPVFTGGAKADGAVAGTAAITFEYVTVTRAATLSGTAKPPVHLRWATLQDYVLLPSSLFSDAGNNTVGQGKATAVTVAANTHLFLSFATPAAEVGGTHAANFTAGTLTLASSSGLHGAAAVANGGQGARFAALNAAITVADQARVTLDRVVLIAHDLTITSGATYSTVELARGASLECMAVTTPPTISLGADNAALQILATDPSQGGEVRLTGGVGNGFAIARPGSVVVNACYYAPDVAADAKVVVHRPASCNACGANTNPCAQGGACTSLVNNGFRCVCPAGYTGNACQTNVDDCASNSACGAHGMCVDGVNTFTCSCAAGFFGSRCQTNADECASNPCRNGGTCVDGDNAWTCSCISGFYGSVCETYGPTGGASGSTGVVNPPPDVSASRIVLYFAQPLSGVANLDVFRNELLAYLSTTYAILRARLSVYSIDEWDVTVASVRARVMSAIVRARRHGTQATTPGFRVIVDIAAPTTDSAESSDTVAARITSGVQGGSTIAGVTTAAQPVQRVCPNGSQATTCTTVTDDGDDDDSSLGLTIALPIAAGALLLFCLLMIACNSGRKAGGPGAKPLSPDAKAAADFHERQQTASVAHVVVEKPTEQLHGGDQGQGHAQVIELGQIGVGVQGTSGGAVGASAGAAPGATGPDVSALIAQVNAAAAGAAPAPAPTVAASGAADAGQAAAPAPVPVPVPATADSAVAPVPVFVIPANPADTPAGAAAMASASPAPAALPATYNYV